MYDYGAGSLTLLVGAIVVSDMSLFFILANYGSFPDVCPHMQRAPHPLYIVRFVADETGNQLKFTSDSSDTEQRYGAQFF